MSGGGRSNSDSFEDLLHCMICFETYRNPKMLVCGHTFCQDCLQGYYKTYQQQRRAQAGKLPCPTCRDLTVLPPGGIPGLRNDFKIGKIEEMFKTVNIRKEKLKKGGGACDVCRAAQKQQRAKYYCDNCSIGYCKDCVKKHEKNPIFKNHKVSARGGPKTVDHASCRAHSGEQAKFFCRSCEQLICTMCIMSEHDGHTVIELSELFSQNQDDVRNLQNVVSTKLEELKLRMSELDKLRSLNLSSCAQAEINIKQSTRNFIEAIRAQETALLEQIHTARDARLSRITEEQERLQNTVAKVVSLQDYANVTAGRTSIRLIAVQEELVQRMRTVAEADASVDPELSAVVTFLPGKVEPNLGRVHEVKGSVHELVNSPMAIIQPPAHLQRRHTANSDSTAAPKVPEPISQLPQRTKLKQLVNIEGIGDKVGELKDPLDVTCLLNGDIVVAEWGNKRVQVFDSVGKPVLVLGAGSLMPQGVAVTLRGNIIVSDASQKRLQVFSPTGVSIAKWGLGKFYAPCGIAISHNGNCIITDAAEHTVNVYQGERKCLRRFGSRGDGDEQFTNPLYVTTGAYNEIIVSDSDNHCIKVFDSHGVFLRKIGSEGSEDGQLKYPRGIATDQDGNIIVVDRNNHRVSMFTPQGRFVKHLLGKEDGIRDPYAVAVSITRNIVITESAANRAAIKVFETE